MTEEELTQAAILKAQSIEKEKNTPMVPQPKATKAAAVKAVAVEKAPEVVPITEEKKSPFSNSLILGKNKEIKFKVWTGKTKKTFKNLFAGANSLADIDFNKVIDLLIRENIDQPDIYFSDIEQQYLMLKLREASLTGEFNFESDCPECSNLQEISSTVEETVQFIPGKYPIIDKDLGVEFVDITLEQDFKNEVEDYTNSPTYDGITTDADIEIAMHIKKDDLDTTDILDWMDSLDLKSLQSIVSTLADAAPQLNLSADRKCETCEKDVTFSTSVIPNMFDELMQ